MTALLATAAAAEAPANEVIPASGAVALAWLLPLLPLLGFVVLVFAGRRLRPVAGLVATAAAAGTFLLSVAIALQVVAQPATYIRSLPTWIAAGDLQVSYDLLIDQLTVVMLLVVTGVGSLVHLYSIGYMHGDPRYERFFAYLNLFLFSMLVLVLGSSFLTLFLGWELVGLCSYLLVGFWFEDAGNASAAKKAFITNRVGDVSFMVGMFLIFAVFGSLSFVEVLPRAGSAGAGVAFAIALLLMGGAAAKSAQIPLYVWLPDAMAGPTPVSALIHAATMVTAGVYLLVRSSPLLAVTLEAMTIIAWIGALTALLAALIAIRQDDIKKILAYSTVSQLGYMVLAVGTGGFREGIFHLTTHAFFKGLLFLAAGAVMHALADRTDVWAMGGLRHAMPVTFWTSAAAVLAISGVPPFAGFFSKDQILTTAYEHGFTAIWLVGLVTAALTAFYMGRWFFLVFWGRPRYGPQLHPHEPPRTMALPLIVLGVLSVVGGLALNPVHDGPLLSWLAPVTPAAGATGFGPAGPLAEPVLILLSVIAGVGGLALAFVAYARRDVSRGRLAEPVRGAVAELAERRFYVDDLYDVVFVRYGGWLTGGAAWFDRRVVDGAVDAAGGLSQLAGRVTRQVQTGLTREYVAAFVVGAVALAAFLYLQVG